MGNHIIQSSFLFRRKTGDDLQVSKAFQSNRFSHFGNWNRNYFIMAILSNQLVFSISIKYLQKFATIHNSLNPSYSIFVFFVISSKSERIPLGFRRFSWKFPTDFQRFHFKPMGHLKNADPREKTGAKSSPVPRKRTDIAVCLLCKYIFE